MPKRLLSVLMVSIVALVVVGTSTLAQSSEDEFWARVDQDMADIQSFIDFANRNDTSNTAVLTRANTLARQLDTSLTIYQERPTIGGPEMQDAIARYVSGIHWFRSGLERYAQGLSTGDQSSISSGIENTNAALVSINSALDAIQEIDEDRVETAERENRQIRQALMASGGAAVLVSIALLIQAGRQGAHELQRVKAAIYGRMFRTSLIPLVGFAITLGTYLIAEGGGTYIVAGGAMLFGALALGRQAYAYFTQAKPSLDAMLAADGLLRSHYPDLARLYGRVSPEEFARVVSEHYGVGARTAQAAWVHIAEQTRSFEHESRPSWNTIP